MLSISLPVQRNGQKKGRPKLTLPSLCLYKEQPIRSSKVGGMNNQTGIDIPPHTAEFRELRAGIIRIWLGRGRFRQVFEPLIRLWQTFPHFFSQKKWGT